MPTENWPQGELPRVAANDARVSQTRRIWEWIQKRIQDGITLFVAEPPHERIEPPHQLDNFLNRVKARSPYNWESEWEPKK